MAAVMRGAEMTEEEAKLRAWLDPDVTSLESLYAELGEASPQSNAFGGDLAKQGRAMLMGMRARLHGAVCGNEKVRNHPAVSGSDNINDTIALAAIIAAVIPAPASVGVNSFLIAALIVRIGVRNFCEGPSGA